jgi:hypothetical protein
VLTAVENFILGSALDLAGTVLGLILERGATG